MTWVRQVGQGRLFYTNLGHTPSTWNDPRFRRQIVEAIRWTGGRTEAPAAPNPTVQDAAALAAFAAVEGLSPQVSPADPAATAAAVHDLQRLHPEKHDGDPAAWDQAVARLRAAFR